MTNLKLSPRLKAIADFIPKDSSVIDIGCDHGLLDIHLTLNKNCSCIASDISLNVLKHTKDNLNKYDASDKVTVKQSDGLENIDITKEDFVVISGMGTSTILNILNNPKVKVIQNLLIQSNNELPNLRENVCKLNFYIYSEKIVTDSGKDYVIIYFKRGMRHYHKYDYLFGPIARKNSENNFYFTSLYNKGKLIQKNIPVKHLLKKIKLLIYLRQIKKFTCIKF